MTVWKKGVEVQIDPFGNPMGGLSEDAVPSWMQGKSFVLVNKLSILNELVEEALKSKLVVIDLESQGLDNRVYNGRPVHHIVGFAICYDGETGFYIPVRHTSAHPNISHQDNGNMSWDIVAPQIQKILDECTCIYHNATFDQELLWAEGFNVKEDPESFDDTQIMGWLIDSNRKRIGLKAMSEDILGWKMIEFKSLFPKGTKIPRFEELHPEEAYIYASSDGICTWNLRKIYKDNDLLRQQSVVYKIEKMLIPVLRRMTRNRVKIDVDYLKELDKVLEAKGSKIQEDIRRLCDNQDLNIDSAKQIGDALFDKLGVPNGGKTESSSPQWKTDRQTLEELDEKFKGKYPALSLLVEYRQLQKLRGTYIENLINNLDENQEGRFGIQACGAPTGRFAAPGGDSDQGYTGVNSQAIPKVSKNKPNIRRAFIARPGFVILAIDFGGVELRIAGNVSNEKKWIDEFRHAECIAKYENDYEILELSPLSKICPYCRKEVGDIHSQTSMNVFGTVEKMYRDKAKGVNFGILYGAGGKTIAENVHVSEDEGYRIVKTFLDALPGIKRWIKEQHKIAAATQMVKTAFGRIRLIPEMKSDNKQQVAFGERTAVNTVVQGASADITKIAMVGCDRLIQKQGWQEHCRMLLTVHDEIVFEIRESMKDIIIPALALTMCKCGPKGWKIPLVVDAEWGTSWGTVDNAWQPPAPKLKALRPDVKPLHPGDLFYDGAVYLENGEKGPSKQEKEETLEVEETPEETIQESKIETETLERQDIVEKIQEYIPQQTDLLFEFILKRPYTICKWRKMEALFILTGTGKTKLRLLSDTGQDLLGNRQILIDPVYFQYKASEWGL